MTDERQEEPRIIIDSDWKEQARKEKEDADRRTREIPGMDQIPDPSIAEILQMIIVQASIALGGMQDPQTGQRIPPSLPVAKHYIDLLELLDRKTAGHLDEEEKQLLDTTLHELRMAFVHMANARNAGGGAEAIPEMEE